MQLVSLIGTVVLGAVMQRALRAEKQQQRLYAGLLSLWMLVSIDLCFAFLIF